MYPIEIEVLSINQAEQRYYSEVPLRFAQKEFLQNTPAASLHARVTLRRDLACRRETIFVFLQESLLCELPSLAKSHFDDYNEHTDDLLENHTFLDFGGEHVRLRIYADSLDGFVNIPESGEPAFDVVFVCGPLVFIASHRPSPEQADNMISGLQGCGICSGVNYKPYVIWSDEELQAAARHKSPSLHGLITARPCYLHHDWRTQLGFPTYA